MKFDAILFDCDGVLVDSEPIVNAVLRDMLEEQGWAMTPELCNQTFIGKTVRDERLAIQDSVVGATAGVAGHLVIGFSWRCPFNRHRAGSRAE